MLSHHVGWPLIEGGSQKLADAMVIGELEVQAARSVAAHLVTDLREFDGSRRSWSTPRPRRSCRWPATG